MTATILTAPDALTAPKTHRFMVEAHRNFTFDFENETMNWDERRLIDVVVKAEPGWVYPVLSQLIKAALGEDWSVGCHWSSAFGLDPADEF